MKIPEIFLENQQHLFEFLIAPIVSVQLFITILIYFVIVRKRIAVDYKLYVYFLLAFILFIGGRIGDIFLDNPHVSILLFVRVGVLYSIGIPSLLVASIKQSEIKKSKFIIAAPYVVGAIISIAYIICMFSHRKYLLLPQYELSWLEIKDGRLWAHRIQILGILTLLVVPCFLLLIKELRALGRYKQLGFLFGALIFGIASTIGLGATPRRFGLFYVGSIVSGICWIWAVFRHIQDMKGKVNIVREELQLLVKSGLGEDISKIDKLLYNIEELSLGNLDVYKLRIRDILNMLTETTIEAGGDTQSLITRNNEQAKAIDGSANTYEIRQIISSEAKAFSKIISEMPQLHNNKVVAEALKYLHNNYTEDLNVDDIAKLVGASRTHFMRIFKKHTGQTFNQYQTSLRIERAKELLSLKTVSETAYLVGYNNPNYFSTVFKKNVGLSPLEYRQNA